MLNEKIRQLDAHMGISVYATRILSELNYACSLSFVKNGKYDAVVEKAADYLTEAVRTDGVITRTSALEAEKILMPLSKDAK
jgi:FAD synthase